jgi:hypothetical protein
VSLKNAIVLKNRPPTTNNKNAIAAAKKIQQKMKDLEVVCLPTATELVDP